MILLEIEVENESSLIVSKLMLYELIARILFCMLDNFENQN